MTELLPKRFKTCNEICFRQEAHEKDRVWQLLADNFLPETIASWTTDLKTAQTFKGGVPQVGLQGVIFTIPSLPINSVVINLVELYKDTEFLDTINNLKSQILRYSDGIGRWHGTQCEVVLDLCNLELAHIFSYGGYSISIDQLAVLYFQRTTTADDLSDFTQLMNISGIEDGGGWWLSKCGTKNVLNRMEPKIQELRNMKVKN